MSADLTPTLPVVAWQDAHSPTEVYIIRKPALIATHDLVRKADAEAALASLQARLDAAERDAARYRWLRDHLDDENWCWVYDDCGRDLLSGARLDTAVDAVIAATQEKP